MEADPLGSAGQLSHGEASPTATRLKRHLSGALSVLVCVAAVESIRRSGAQRVEEVNHGKSYLMIGLYIDYPVQPKASCSRASTRPLC